MAIATDNKFVVKHGLHSQNIDFVSPDTTNKIEVVMSDSDTLSFSGDSGELFSITDDTTGTIFSVINASSISIIEADADGTIRLAETTGNVLIGTATDNGTDKVQIDGNLRADFFKGNGSLLTNVDSSTLDGQNGSYYLDFTNFTNLPDPQVTVTLTGDVTGSANTTLTDLGNGTVSVATTISANSVQLGTDTTGNYVATIAGTANEIEVSGSGTEGAAVTIGLPNNVTIGNNLTVTGNLIVSGTTTTVNTETINLADNIITLNSNYTGSAPTENGGIEVERGTLTNTVLRWNETSDRWEFTNNGSTYYNIPLPAEYDTANDATITLSAGTALTGGGDFTTDQATAETITFNHDSVARNDTSSTATPNYGANFTVVDSVTSNAQGHITAINVKTVTLPASDNVDNYVDSITFNTVSGELTLGRTGALSDLSVDLDGRYLTSVSIDDLTDAVADSWNVGLGLGSLIGFPVGQAAGQNGRNTAVGPGTLGSLSSGTQNVSIGYNTGAAATTANRNTLVGVFAGTSLSTGGDNVAIGASALYGDETNKITGSRNTFVGNNSGTLFTTGNNNTALGYRAGRNLVSGSNNILIGHEVDATTASTNNEIVIGNTTNDRLRIPGLDLDTNDAADGEVLQWNTTNNGFVWTGIVDGATFDNVTNQLTLSRTGGSADLTIDLGGSFLPLSGGTLTGAVDTSADISTSANINFADDAKAIFGDAGELEIYHSSGGASSITAVNPLFIETDNNFFLRGTTSFKSRIEADEGMGVRLFYNGFEKLTTSSTGIIVDGDITTINSGSLIIAGDLTVSGTTTTVNTETINLADNIITLNSNATGTPSENSGIEVERGDSTNVALRWNETSDRWEFTNDGTNYFNLPVDAEYGSANDATITLSAGTYLSGGGDFTTDQAANETLTFNHDTTTRTNTSSTDTATYGGTITVVDSVSSNATGHVTGVNTKTITLPASDNTDNYVDSISFDTGTGVLTVGRTGALADLTVDLDGRYLESYTESNDFGTVTVTDTDSGYSWSATGSASSDTLGDTLTLVSGANVNIDVDATNDAIRISATDTDTVPNDATITLSAGTYISGGGDFTTDQSVAETITFNHDATTRTNTTSTDSPGFGTTFTVIDSVSSNATGHVTGVNTKTITLPTETASTDNYVDGVSFNTTDGVLTLTRTGALADLTVDLDGRYSTSDTTNFNIQANGGTEVNISAGEEINFINGTYTTAAVVNQANPTVTFNHDSTTRSDSTSTASPAAGGTFTAVDGVTTNATGHVTGINVKTVTLPAPEVGASVTTSDSPPPTPSQGDLWWDSDDGALYVYYDGFFIETNPTLGSSSNPEFNSLGIGTFASGTTGEIRATNDVTAYYSDARLKNFEGTIDNALDKVQSLNGYYFRENETAKSLGYDNSNRQVGVSAQEVEAVLPEVVTAAPISDEYLTVKYEKMVPLLIEAIKEIDTKYTSIIDEQQRQIDMLVDQINRLKGDN